ncbi:MAG: 50S ribosomal protein L11 methyltransferase [Planctomycetota bacterium]
MLAIALSPIQSADMRWFALHVGVREAEAELAQLLLHEHGSTGIECRDGPLLVAWFRGRDDAERARADVCARFPGARTRLASAPDRDWAREWRRRVRALRVGRLWVGPPWLRGKAPRGAIALVIEPGMAFGTGDHPTTALCLAAVDAFCAEHEGASVLDVGTGSGLLALAARALGASRVIGIDTDPVAVSTARANARANRLSGVRFSATPIERVRGVFDLVVANLTGPTLLPLAPLLRTRTRSRLVLCGIRANEARQVEAAYAALGLAPLRRASRRGWVRLTFSYQHRPADP